MAALTVRELATLVQSKGFAQPDMAIAVILGESGGNPQATNRETGNVDRGLWQISSKWHPSVTDAQAFDVNWSTDYALQLSKGGTDWSPWHATKAPQFAGHLQTARDELAGWSTVGGVTGAIAGAALGVKDTASGVVGAVTGIGSGVGDVLALAGQALGLLTSRDFWFRAGLVLAGVVLLIVAGVLVFGRRAAAVAATASPVA